MSLFYAAFLLLCGFVMCRATRVALPKRLGLWGLAGGLSCLFLAFGAAAVKLLDVAVWNWNSGVVHACVYFGRCPNDLATQVFTEALLLLVPFVAVVLIFQSDRPFAAGEEFKHA